MEVSQYFPVWERLSEGHRQRILNASTLHRVKRGTILHNGSLDCVGLLLVREGQLRAYILSDEGREVTLYRLFERDTCLFSASCIISSIQCDITIEAEKDTEYWLVAPMDYKAVMEESAPVANYTNQLLATRFSEVMWLMEQVMWRSMDRRLAAFLLEESQLEGTDELRITHERIANHMGTAREVITRMLRYFQSEGMVKLMRGVVAVTHRERLQELACQ